MKCLLKFIDSVNISILRTKTIILIIKIIIVIILNICDEMKSCTFYLFTIHII